FVGAPRHRRHRLEVGQGQGRDRTAGAAAHHVSAAPRTSVVTRIDFYHEAEDRLAIACRLVAKAFQQQLRVVIYAPRAEVADAVDRMLWISPSIGFLPHVRADHRLAPETPILIAGEDSDPLTHDDVLI